MITVPFFSLLLAVTLAHTVLGPIGWIVGDWISNIVWAGLNSSVKWLFALYLVLYMHHLLLQDCTT